MLNTDRIDFDRFGTYNSFKYAKWCQAYKDTYFPLPLLPEYNEAMIFERDFFAL